MFRIDQIGTWDGGETLASAATWARVGVSAAVTVISLHLVSSMVVIASLVIVPSLDAKGAPRWHISQQGIYW